MDQPAGATADGGAHESEPVHSSDDVIDAEFKSSDK
jgi:hypothetical protein